MTNSKLQKSYWFDFLYKKGKYCDEKGRLYYFDNAKFILIFFVVFAHGINPLKGDSAAMRMLWTVINTMHMPALIFISGFFAKRYLDHKGGIRVQRLFTYAILYLASQFAVALFERVVLKEDIHFSIFSARSSLWFLQCLFGWYIVLPILEKFKPAYVMIGAVALALVVGYDQNVGNFLSFSRFLVHLPFFMGGYYCTSVQIEKLKNKKFKLFSAVFWIAACVIVYIMMRYQIKFPSAIITCKTPYNQISGIGPFYLWWTARLIFYIAALLFGTTFFALVPKCKTFFTKFGTRTLQVYILHRFLYLAYLKYDWAELFNSFTGKLLLMCLLVVITFVLSCKIFSIPFDLLQKIKVDRFLKGS